MVLFFSGSLWLNYLLAVASELCCDHVYVVFVYEAASVFFCLDFPSPALFKGSDSITSAHNREPWQAVSWGDRELCRRPFERLWACKLSGRGGRVSWPVFWWQCLGMSHDTHVSITLQHVYSVTQHIQFVIPAPVCYIQLFCDLWVYLQAYLYTKCTVVWLQYCFQFFNEVLLLLWYYCGLHS